MEEIYARLLTYAQVLFERAVFRFEKEEFRKADFAVAASLSVAAFVSEDDETPEGLRNRARLLRRSTESLQSEI